VVSLLCVRACLCTCVFSEVQSSFGSHTATQHTATHCNTLKTHQKCSPLLVFTDVSFDEYSCSVLQCAVCCCVLQCVAVCCSVLQCAAVCCSVLQCAAVCCSVLQCVAVCCSVVQCGGMRVGFFWYENFFGYGERVLSSFRIFPTLTKV